MIPYRVFKQDSSRVLHYDASSEALGAGGREIALIVDGHQLWAGDVVEIDGQWILLAFDGSYDFLPPYGDDSYVFGDGRWSLEMRARLQHEAAVCEEITQEAQQSARRRR